ncbi:short-chain dehydrogenase [Spongiactinospora gelatinilytica]|uniref:Short-chain dehydrogenase n=1 Tax=Spongiactinospora gelatinilytica TaxID=2666298 RepID=A0A2W2GL70_9ACTN|nr:SDR family NAD(P)-dependent oxidoreductase [Spongiactinospora gelatinilytica]PZG35027.1 short-chain dehydrogenase [Spongiactinospora gelatinilytica]
MTYHGSLAGKRVLVTGGSRGIGAATARAFTDAGARVLACHRGAPAAMPYELVTADVTREQDVAALIDRCAERLGGLDVVVNNAGVDGVRPVDKLDLAAWQEVIDANLTSAFLVTRQALGLLGEGTSVIDLGASVALRGRPASAHYTAAKAALIGLVRSLARELGPRGIRVNAVAPGVIDAGGPDGGPPPHLRERLAGMTALGRLGTAEEVADAVLFLASDQSRYITGTVLNVDGGM